MKQFMVNQLKLNFERGRIILSPFDEVLHKQLVDYEVDHISQSGVPVYTSKNEHFVDALGLAHLAFVLKFPDLTGAIKTLKTEAKLQQVHVDPLNRQANAALRDLDSSINPWKNTSRVKQIGKDPDELPGDYQKWVHVPLTSGGGRSYHSSWGSRSGRNSGGGRTMW